jgi:hypothetical protein
MTQDFDLQRTLREVQLNGYLALEAQYKDNHRFFYQYYVFTSSN